MGRQYPATGSGALNTTVLGALVDAGISPFEEGHHYCYYFYHSLASGQTTGREHSPINQQKIGLKIYWAWRHPSEQTQIPPLLSGRFHKPLILIHHQDRQNENCNHRKQTKLITWITASFNSIKLWALPHKANQDGRVMMESSDKMWSTGEENGKPLQFSCLENPMNSMKRQKDMTLKDELLSQ